MDEDEFGSPPIPITHLRDSLGFFYQHVAKRIGQSSFNATATNPSSWSALEWRWLKELESKVRRGEPIIAEEQIDGS